MDQTEQLFRVVCRHCGQHGELRLTTSGPRDWCFSTLGFVGLAVNRYNPANSVLRCYGCGGPHVWIEPMPPQQDAHADKGERPSQKPAANGVRWPPARAKLG